IAERLLVDSTTYVVVSNLARLSLPKAVLVTNITAEFKRYRDSHICPFLSTDDRVRLIYQSEKEQLEFINQFRPVDASLGEIGFLGMENEDKRVFLRKLTRGLFNKNLEILKENHDPVQVKVEKLLTKFLKEEVSPTNLNQLKTKDISQKDLSQLSY